MGAYRSLQQLEREQLALNELQGAQLCNLTYNLNRDQKKGKILTLQDWQFFHTEQRKEEDKLPAVVAHICLALRHEEKLPSLLLGIWKEVIAQASQGVEMPEIRCLVSADQNCIAVAPVWESKNLRTFLAVKTKKQGELVELFDIDRPMLSYKFKLPLDIQAIHYEAGVLLLSGNDKGGLATST